ncbi:MAG: hydrogenase nickel incorporation protein HypA [Candidatus Hydrogenedentota bacterium]|nr:MAG: hydrogenase nickel incorporation protein HypA [Candidatus Hydrogenedentota bacterium]
MHEASLMKDLIRKINSLTEEASDGRITTVHVWLGALSHMSADHFRYHFEQVSKGTAAEGALLSIEESTDIHDPNAQGLLLLNIEIET